MVISNIAESVVTESRVIEEDSFINRISLKCHYLKEIYCDDFKNQIDFCHLFY